MRKSVYVAIVVLAVTGFAVATARLVDSRQLPGNSSTQAAASLFTPGSADVSVSVDSFTAPISVEVDFPLSFSVGMTVENAGSDADQVVIVKTLAVPLGCKGSLAGSIDTVGPDTAVVFGGLPVLNAFANTPNGETVEIECLILGGTHTFTYRVEVQPLYADDADQSDNLVVVPFTVCEVSNGAGDPDGDGVSNAQEEAAGTNPCAVDSDLDGVIDGTDNCGTVANPDQLNSDSGPPPPATNVGGIGNGPTLVGDDITVPNGDALGNVCDDDQDNDELDDLDDGALLTGCNPVGTPAGHPSPTLGDNTYNDNGDLSMLGSGDNGPSWDTDGDSVRDGVECLAGTNPRLSAAAHRTACNAFAGGTIDADVDGITNQAEVCKWGTSPSDQNSDDDSLGDCREIMDVNGSRTVNNIDAVFVQQAFFGAIANDGGFDINGSGVVNNTDAVLIQQAYFGGIPCP